MSLLNKRPQRDGDDKSVDWSLPDWSELQEQNRRSRRRKRRRRRREQEIKSAARKEKEKQEAVQSLAVDAERATNLSVTLSPYDDGEGDEDEGSTDEDEIAAKERGQWNNSCEFLLSIISMSVGMGNFYRFPFVAFQNGGGAFLIPYVFILTFVGRPMYFLELAVGQFCSFGQVKCWKMSPFFRGVGFGSALGSFCAVTYYSSVMALTIFYFINSFQATLPWSECDPDWATEEVCRKIEDAHQNGTSGKMVANLAQLYFERIVTNEKDNIDDGIGVPQWKQTLCLLASWLIIFGVIARGVKSSGKVAYFTTFYPFVIILTLLITSCTKAGSFEGMLYFITPDWHKILDANVWFAAAGQCFFSLSTGFGPIINYGSYSTFHQPIYKNVMIVTCMDTLASFIAGLTVFATLGTLSYEFKKPIEEVVKAGPGLVFISFSGAIANVAYVPQLLAVLFFSMLLTLAVGGSVAWTMAAISVISDQFPKFPKILVTAGVCSAGFLIALIYVTPGGQYMVTLMDNFGGNVNIYILTILECIGISYVYGLKNFVRDVEFMLGRKIGFFWKLCWGFVVPVLLTIVLIYSLATSKRLEYNGKSFPDSAIICGWLLTSASVIFVPIGAIYAICKTPGTIRERLIGALKPTSDFGPRNAHDREQWELYKAGKIDLDLEPVDDFDSEEPGDFDNDVTYDKKSRLVIEPKLAVEYNEAKVASAPSNALPTPLKTPAKPPIQKVINALASAPILR